jgi:murein DD-endopeptidase MepM/ murein hydrolase activator NlpD
VLSPIAASRPTRLSRLAILCAVLLVSVSPAPATARAATGTTAVAPATPWAWPVPAPHRLVTPFVAPATPWAAGHRGIDIEAAVGASVRAPTDGVVYFSGMVVDRPVLSIRHVDGLVSSYEPVFSELAAGAAVRGGDVIGSLVSGHCASACLHFGVRRYGAYVSPLAYLGGIMSSVLLPTRRLP